MARPLSTSDGYRGGPRSYADFVRPTMPAIEPGGYSGHGQSVDTRELEALREENVQLRRLCTELEQALQEAAQQGDQASGERVKEYEGLLEEKNEMIRVLHQKLQEAQEAKIDAEAQLRARPEVIPREEELLALSEELERERRQLQEDEETLMDQMRSMEMSMARERADMARQRNELERLRNEIAHELDRLERTGALQSKIQNLRSSFHDISARRGAAPGRLGR
jgi:chromosome segregation ATPase